MFSYTILDELRDGIQQAHHGQMTTKQRYISVDSVCLVLP